MNYHVELHSHRDRPGIPGRELILQLNSIRNTTRVSTPTMQGCSPPPGPFSNRAQPTVPATDWQPAFGRIPHRTFPCSAFPTPIPAGRSRPEIVAYRPTPHAASDAMCMRSISIQRGDDSHPTRHPGPQEPPHTHAIIPPSFRFPPTFFTATTSKRLLCRSL